MATGDCYLINLGQQYDGLGSLGQFGLNDAVSSVKVGGNVTLLLYPNENFGGGEYRFTPGDYGNLDNGYNGQGAIGKNKASSLKVVPKQQTCSDPGSEQIVVYDDKEFKGSCKTYSVDDYSDLGEWVNRIKSVKVGSGAMVRFYEDTGFIADNGAETFYQSDSDLSDNSEGMYGDASSMKVRRKRTCSPSADQAAIYDREDFTDGDCHIVNLGQSYSGLGGLGEYGMQDMISSVKVGANVTLLLYPNESFGGGEYRFTPGEYNNLDNGYNGQGSIGKNKASSLKVVSKQPVCSAPSASQVVLYADSGFKGNCKTLDVADYTSLGELDGKVSSVQLGSAAVLVLYSAGGFGNTADVYYDSEDDLGDNSDTARSARVRQESTCSESPDVVVLYDKDGREGLCRVFAIGEYATLEILDNVASSAFVGANVIADLYPQAGFSGGPVTINASVDDLDSTPIKRNEASSLKVRRPDVAQAAMFIDPADQTVSANTEFCIQIAVEEATDLGAFQFTLAYPPDLLEAKSVTIGAFLGSSGRTVVPVNPTIDNTTGKVTYGAASLGNDIPGPNGNGNLAQVCLMPKKAGVAALDLTNGVMTTRQGQSIPVALSDGSVTISSCYWADVNCDNKVDIIDIQLVAGRWGAKLGDPQYDPLYDIDDNDKIDIIDIQMVAGQWGWPTRSSRSEADSLEAPLAPVTFTLDPSQLNLAVGETKTFDLRVSGAQNLAAFETTIDYNPALLKVNGVTLGNFLGSTGRPIFPVGPTIDNNAGTVRFGAFSLGAEPPGPNGSGVLATVSVTGLASGNGTLDMQDSTATDPNGATSPVTETDGTFVVSGDGLSAPVINDINNSDGDGNFPVGWAPVSGATGYTLQERFNGGSWSEIYSGPNTNTNRTNRSDGEWCYRVRAYDNSEDSNWSAIECTTVSTTVSPPQAPTLYSIGNPGQQNSYWVSWSAVNTATSYELQESYSSGSFSQIYSGSDTSQYIFGQSEGVWCYRVRARNVSGPGGWSGTQCTTVEGNTGSYSFFIPFMTRP